MTPVLLVGVALAGGLGAGLRWLLDALLFRMRPAGFPWPVLVVNITGSLALGILTGAAAEHTVMAIVGTGLLGGYTTWSTVAVDTQLLWRRGQRRRALLNSLGSLVLCTLAALAGLLIGAIGAH